MRKIVLDTNAYTRLLLGDEGILDALAKADIVWVPVFVLGELYAGFCGGNKEKENRLLLERFLQKPTVAILDATQETAEIFGRLKHTLKGAGTSLPLNDVWIAAQVIENGAVLVTFDVHFQKIPGLRIWHP
jgi:tRNA(fMet)-specific endonuclease VapC